MEHNKPVELYVSKGYFKYSTNNNRGKITYTMKVTDLGIEFLAGIITLYTFFLWSRAVQQPSHPNYRMAEYVYKGADWLSAPLLIH